MKNTAEGPKFRTAVVELESVSPYGQSRHYSTERIGGESNEAYEKRTWRDRMHVNADGFVFIPAMAFKNCLSESARYLSMKIPGKRNATYTKKFEAGILVAEDVVLPIRKEDVPSTELYVPSDGVRGGTTRVTKFFPTIHKWKATVTVHVLELTITEDVFREHMETAGRFVGIGFFRPNRNGYFGRFAVKNLCWS